MCVVPLHSERYISGDMDDMHNIFRRPGAQTWSVRFHVPRERQEDVGKALGVRSGRLAERVRTLRTTNRAEALGRRPAALEAIRQEIDAKLIQAGFPPLQGEWRPDWAVEQSDVVSEALEARRELEAVSDVPDQTEEMPNNRTIRTSPKDRLRDTIVDVISDRAIDMNEAGQDGDTYYKSYTEVAFGEATPLGELLDRWFRDIEGTLKKQTLSMFRLSFRLLGEFLITVRHSSQKTLITEGWN